MKEMSENLSKVIESKVDPQQFELVDVQPIRTNREAEQILKDSENQNFVNYIIRFQPKDSATQKPEKTEEKAKGEESRSSASLTDVYLSNGKLDIDYLEKNASLLTDAKEFGLARQIYEAILHSGQRTHRALFNIGRTFEIEGKLSEAKQRFEDAVAYLPSLQAYQHLAAVLIRQRKDEYAAEVLERALVLKDLNEKTIFDLHKACGNCWARAKRSEQAEAQYRKALEIRPDADEVHSNLGSLYLEQSRMEEAERAFEAALSANPRNQKAFVGLGICYLNQGKKVKAYDQFVRALNIDLNHPKAIFYLIKCAYETKRFREAERIVSDYVKQAPVNPNLLYSLAGIQFHLKRYDEARKTANRVLAIQDSHQGAKELIQLVSGKKENESPRRESNVRKSI